MASNATATMSATMKSTTTGAGANNQTAVGTMSTSMGADLNAATADISNAKNTGGQFNVNDVIVLSRPDRTLNQRRQSAMYFAHLSTDPAVQVKLVDLKRNYGLEPLVSLLQSNDGVCQRFCALAIGNMASNEYCRQKMVDAGLLRELMTVAVTVAFDPAARRYSTFAVGNLAASVSTHPSFVELVPAIIELVDSPDAEIQRYATLILQNLAADPKMVTTLLRSGMVSPLLNLLANLNASSLPDASLHTLSVLRCLSVDDLVKPRLINEGLLKQMIHLVESPVAAKVIIEVAAVLNNMSTSFDSHREMASTPMLHAFFALLQTDLEEVHFYVINALANLASNAETHLQLDETNVPHTMLKWCSNTDDRIRIGATRGLANLCSNRGLHRNLVRLGLLPVLLRMFTDPEMQCRLFSVLMIAILSEDPLLLEELRLVGYIPALFKLLQDPMQVETVRYATLALANIASDLESHRYQLDEINLLQKRFYSLTDASDEETVQYFGLWLSNLAVTGLTRYALLESELLRRVIPLALPWKKARTLDAIELQAMSRNNPTLTTEQLQTKHSEAVALSPAEHETCKLVLTFFIRLMSDADADARHAVANAGLPLLLEMADRTNLLPGVPPLLLRVIRLLAENVEIVQRMWPEAPRLIHFADRVLLPNAPPMPVPPTSTIMIAAEVAAAAEELAEAESKKKVAAANAAATGPKLGATSTAQALQQTLPKPEDDPLQSTMTGTAARVFLKALKTARPPQPLTSGQVEALCRDLDPLIKKDGLDLLCTLAHFPITRRPILFSRLWEAHVLPSLTSSYEELQQLGLQLACFLSSDQDPACVESFRQNRVTEFAAPFVRSVYLDVRKVALVCLGNLALHPGFYVSLVDTNLFMLAAELVADPHSDLEETRCCLFALLNTIMQPYNFEACTRLGGIKLVQTLKSLTSCPDKPLVRLAVKCFHHLVNAIGESPAFGEPAFVMTWRPMIENLVVSSDRIVKLYAMKAFRSLASHEHLAKALVGSDAILAWLHNELRFATYVSQFTLRPQLKPLPTFFDSPFDLSATAARLSPGAVEMDAAAAASNQAATSTAASGVMAPAVEADLAANARGQSDPRQEHLPLGPDQDMRLELLNGIALLTQHSGCVLPLAQAGVAAALVRSVMQPMFRSAEELQASGQDAMITSMATYLQIVTAPNALSSASPGAVGEGAIAAASLDESQRNRTSFKRLANSALISTASVNPSSHPVFLCEWLLPVQCPLISALANFSSTDATQLALQEKELIVTMLEYTVPATRHAPLLAAISWMFAHMLSRPRMRHWMFNELGDVVLPYFFRTKNSDLIMLSTWAMALTPPDANYAPMNLDAVAFDVASKAKDDPKSSFVASGTLGPVKIGALGAQGPTPIIDGAQNLANTLNQGVKDAQEAMALSSAPGASTMNPDVRPAAQYANLRPRVPDLFQQLSRLACEVEQPALTRQFALMALIHYTCNPQLHTSILTLCPHLLMGLFDMVHAMPSDIKAARLLALFCANLCANRAIHRYPNIEALITANLIEPLTFSEDPDTRFYAFSAIRGMSVTLVMVQHMLKSEVLLPQMAVFVLDCPMRLRRCFAQILFNFSCHKSLYTFYLHRRVLHCMLLIALTPPPVELVLLYDIARSLWHMLSVEETRNALLTHEYGLPALWMMLKSTIDPILALSDEQPLPGGDSNPANARDPKTGKKLSEQQKAQAAAQQPPQRKGRTAIDEKITAEDAKEAVSAAVALVKPNFMERLMAGESKLLQSVGTKYAQSVLIYQLNPRWAEALATQQPPVASLAMRCLALIGSLPDGAYDEKSAHVESMPLIRSVLQLTAACTPGSEPEQFISILIYRWCCTPSMRVKLLDAVFPRSDADGADPTQLNRNNSVRAPISHRSDGSPIADNAMSDCDSILHVLCRLSVSPHYNVQKAALYGFRELVACQSPLLLRFVALEPLCLVAMLHVMTCRQHVKLQREALQLLCYVIEQAAKVPAAQFMLPSVSTASSLVAAAGQNGGSPVRFRCLSLPDVLPQLVKVEEIRHISIPHCVDRMILRRFAELDGMPILVRVAHPPTAAASQDLACLRSIALLGARFSRYLDFLVPMFLANKPFYQLLNALIGRGDPFICLQAAFTLSNLVGGAFGFQIAGAGLTVSTYTLLSSPDALTRSLALLSLAVVPPLPKAELQAAMNAAAQVAGSDLANGDKAAAVTVKSTDFLVRDGELASSYVTEDKVGAGNVESALFDAQPRVVSDLLEPLVATGDHDVTINVAWALHHIGRAPVNLAPLLSAAGGAQRMMNWAVDPHQTPLLRRSALLIIRNYLASISKRVATSSTANAANAAMENSKNAEGMAEGSSGGAPSGGGSSLYITAIATHELPESVLKIDENVVRALARMINNPSEPVTLRHLALSVLCALCARLPLHPVLLAADLIPGLVELVSHTFTVSWAGAAEDRKQAITRSRAMLATSGVPPCSILHLLPPMCDSSAPEDEDRDVPAQVLEDTEMMISWMETDMALLAATALCNLAAAPNSQATLLERGALPALLAFARAIALCVPPTTAALQRNKVMMPGEAETPSADGFDLPEPHSAGSGAGAKGASSFFYRPPPRSWLSRLHRASDYMSMLRLCCSAISSLSAGASVWSGSDSSLLGLPALAGLLAGAAGKVAHGSLKFIEPVPRHSPPQVHPAPVPGINIALDWFCCGQLACAFRRLLCAPHLDWTTISVSEPLYVMLSMLMRSDQIEAQTQHAALQAWVALLLKARVPHALVEANDLIDPLMGFVHPSADCAVLLLALAGLDMLSQRPTILHRFYHSDRLPALFYVSFVHDFDVQCAVSRILSRLVYGETAVMKRYADALVPALVHFVLASSTALADTLHPHLFPNGLQALRDGHAAPGPLDAEQAAALAVKPDAPQEHSLQEIIDALATPGARGLLALLNEPLFDEVLIRRTKYGMDCLLLLLQHLPFDVEERESAQMLLLRILGRWGGELDLIKQVVKAHVLPAVLPLLLEPRVPDPEYDRLQKESDDLAKTLKYKGKPAPNVEVMAHLQPVLGAPNESCSLLPPPPLDVQNNEWLAKRAANVPVGTAISRPLSVRRPFSSKVAPHAGAEQQRHIALVLRSAFRFVDHHPYLVQLGGFDCLFRLLSGTDEQAREEALYTLHDLVQRYPMDANLFQGPGITVAMVDMLSCGVRLSVGEPPSASMRLSFDTPMAQGQAMREVALLALVRLCRVDEFQALMVEAGVLPVLAHLFQQAPAFITPLLANVQVARWQGSILQILATLVENEQLHSAFVADPGTLAVMVEVAYRPDPNQQRIAIRMASLLALDPSHAESLGKCGIIRCFGEIRQIKELDNGIRKVATDTLLALLENEAVIKMASVDPDIMQIVTSMSRYGADDVRRKASRILGLISNAITS